MPKNLNPTPVVETIVDTPTPEVQGPPAPVLTPFSAVPNVDQLVTDLMVHARKWYPTSKRMRRWNLIADMPLDQVRALVVAKGFTKRYPMLVAMDKWVDARAAALEGGETLETRRAELLAQLAQIDEAITQRDELAIQAMIDAETAEEQKAA